MEPRANAVKKTALSAFIGADRRPKIGFIGLSERPLALCPGSPEAKW